MTVSFEAVTTWPQARELRALRNECREHMTGDTREISRERQRWFFTEKIQPGKVRAWLLRRGGLAAGYATLRPAPDGAAWMSCGLAAQARGQGLGHLLVDLVTATGLHEAGIVRLEVWQDNAPARRVYLKAGYAITGSEDRGGRIVEFMERW